MQAGRLFYLMGASGTGKDSLLHYLRSHLCPESRVKLPQRWITRPADAGGEDHIAISAAEFQERLSKGEFALHWQSHGFHYGIGREINSWLDDGVHVVINGSRHHLQTAHALYPTMQPVLIRVSHHTLFERLTRRGRENAQEIEQRLQRAEALDRHLPDNDLVVINNDGPLAIAGESLLQHILSTTMAEALEREDAHRELA
jgi:ribose 1,5-bisphosphokinase